MASVPVDGARRTRIGALIAACIAEHGSAGHPYFAGAELLRGADASRNLADAVHFICTLHGRHPGVIDLAADRERQPQARSWLERSAEAFAAERLYLTRLAVAAGPVPGTPGGSVSEAAVIAQRGALATLARSERNGCALGAALGLVADWTRMRETLDVAAHRLGVEPPVSSLPDLDSVRAAAETAAGNATVERALLFGAEQILVQHHGLWGLLEARAQARRNG